MSEQSGPSERVPVPMRLSPKNPYDSAAAERVLSVAGSYLENADALIYSYGSRTFLSGYDLFDPDYGSRGNIDCSTFVLLVLAGVPYGKSPYAGVPVRSLALRPLAEVDLSCFEDIPGRYMGIAERIGRPYLAGPKGLDLDRAEQLGIPAETLRSEIRASGVKRRSEAMAAELIGRDECFSDSSFLCPGDLVFYRSVNFFGPPGEQPPGEAPVTHVGIVCEDTREMINSSGYLSKEKSLLSGRAAVSVTPVFSRRIPAFFARPRYFSPETPENSK